MKFIRLKSEVLNLTLRPIKGKVRYRVAGSSDPWITQTSISGNNFLYINDLTPYTLYQYQVRSNCNAYGGGDDWSAYVGSFFHETTLPRLATSESTISTRIYPNPVNDILNVEFETEVKKDINITVFDHLGKVVHMMNQTYLKGSQRESLDMSSFANGYYIITIQGNDMMETFKFVKI